MAHILLADDDSSVRSFVSRALEQQGHEITAVSDGLQALEWLQGAPFDLLITDIVMPELDGIALALRAASDMPQLPVLLMSGYATERQRAHNLEELAFRIISKPFSLAEICRAAEEALDRVGRPVGVATAC
jgi:CheY-like chemotaxis protein